MLPEDMVLVLDKPALLGEERVQRQSKPTRREPVPPDGTPGGALEPCLQGWQVL